MEQMNKELKLVEKLMMYNFSTGRRTELVDGYYHIYDGDVLLAKVKQEIICDELITA